jgi:type I restriction enzyme S subunit
MSDELLKSAFLEMFGWPNHPNPAQKVVPLGEICDLFAGNSLPPGEAYNGQDAGLLLLKVADLNLPGNDQTVTTAREWVSEKGSTRAAIVAPKNAIVFPKRGGAIATNKKRVLGRPSVLDPNLMAVAPKEGAPITYAYLRMWFELLDLTSISNGSTVPQLNKGDLHPLKIVVPDGATLAAFERVFQGVRSARQKHASDVACSEALFASLSQRAFRGEL